MLKFPDSYFSFDEDNIYYRENFQIESVFKFLGKKTEVKIFNLQMFEAHSITV